MLEVTAVSVYSIGD